MGSAGYISIWFGVRIPPNQPAAEAEKAGGSARYLEFCKSILDESARLVEDVFDSKQSFFHDFRQLSCTFDVIN
jgi:hypothetical protein